MIAIVAAVLVVCAAVWLVFVLKTPAHLARVLVVSQSAMAALQDPDATDDEKELMARRSSGQLFVLFFRLLISFSVALLAPIGVVWLLSLVHIVSLHAVLAVLVSIPFLIISTVVGCVIGFIWSRLRKPGGAGASTGSGGDYSFLDRLLHRLAFASWPIQAALADMEEVSFKARLEGVAVERPVFVAGLPRAGTTLVLQLIENTGEFASYRYRDMPFLLTPMLWTQMTKSSQRSVESRERAHGDGVRIGLDSPEAFEEVVWRTFNGKQYGPDAIKVWGAGVDEDFDKFFRAQMRKIIAIRAEEAPKALRYLSKGNGNIARLANIARMFPDAAIITPYRRPLDQARSLLRQHQNFLAMHASDPFSRDYMGAIGHYDFGMNLKPIDFSNWLESGARPDFTSINGWIAYWSAAYGFLLDQANSIPIRFVSYDALCDGGTGELARLESMLDLAHPGALLSQASDIRTDESRLGVDDAVDTGLLDQANAIFARLEARRAA